MSKNKTALIAGMFDMNNYGDLLFPIIAQHELSKRNIDLHVISPTGNPVDYLDALNSKQIWSALDPDFNFDGILIGGGYIVHTHRMDFLREYQNNIGASVAPSTWLGSTLIGALRDVPIVWNAPGVPHPIRPGVRKLALSAFKAADYLSFRDEGSVKLAGLEKSSNVKVVPDPVLGLSAVWSKPSLESIYYDLLEKLGVDKKVNVLACHLRKRSLGKDSINIFVEKLVDVSQSKRFFPILLGLGSAHNDNETAKEICALLSQRGIDSRALVPPTNLKTIASLIAYSSLYAGSSLHGYITAKTYGVDAFLIAKPAYKKFEGLINHLGAINDVSTDWNDAWSKIQAIKLCKKRVSSKIYRNLDLHWDSIATQINTRTNSKSSERLEFLSLTISEGLNQSGDAWITTPYTTAKDRKDVLNLKDSGLRNPF